MQHKNQKFVRASVCMYGMLISGIVLRHLSWGYKYSISRPHASFGFVYESGSEGISDTELEWKGTDKETEPRAVLSDLRRQLRYDSLT